MKFKVGDKVKVINNDDAFIGLGSLGFVQSFEEGLYAVRFEEKTQHLKEKQLKLVKNKNKKRIKKLEKEVAELKLIVSKLREPSNLVKEELLYNSDLIEFEGKKYKKVNRLAQIGDVVIFKKNKTLKSYSTVNKPYKVSGVDSIGVTFIGERTNSFNVYAPAHKRNHKNVVVYELITDKQSANEVK